MTGTANAVLTYDAAVALLDHVLESTPGDIVDRNDIELLVRKFYRDAAIDDGLGPCSEQPV